MLLATFLVTAPLVLIHLPTGALQPQAAVDDHGVVHVVYFRGPDTAGDLYYSRVMPGSKDLGRPIRVNSSPGTAGAVGTVRTAQVATGRNGHVFVAWNGL